MRGICLTLALVLTSTSALAKSHFLPDYQGAGLDERVQEFENPQFTNACSVYGMYSSIQSGMTCRVAYPASGLTCYTCYCDGEYKYTAADCPTSTYTLSEQCGGKYKNCNCDTTLYPTTSITSGCPSGQVPDASKYCEDKPDGTKHYACTNLNCNPENITIEECKAKGKNCTASTEANCTDYCDTNGCQDNCTYLKQTGQARSDCQYGCAAGKEVSGCSNLCYECITEEEQISCPLTDDKLSAIFDGKSNTQKIVAQLGNEALAAYAATQFYVGDKNGTFGQGNWYLPAIGELIYMYGINASEVTEGYSNSGAVGDNMAKINEALTTLKIKGIEADALNRYERWSSSEWQGDKYAWKFDVSNGTRNPRDKGLDIFVRPFLLLENTYNPFSEDTVASKIGDVIYDDKTFSSVVDYDGSKTPVGIVVAVSTASIKIVGLKDLTFSSSYTIGNFDADNPYAGGLKTNWATYNKSSENIDSIADVDYLDIYNVLKNCPAY